MNGHHSARRVGEHKDVARRQAPNVGRRILDGGRVPSGHQRFQAGKIRQQFRGAGQADFSLALKIPEYSYRIAQALCDFFAELNTDGSTNHPERDTGDAGRHQQERK